ncbi:MAG TPA: efflux RND transporter periplasmic adaptor subunit [Chlamydiales bacterium]|jgi:multidrug resistance efflux pump
MSQWAFQIRVPSIPWKRLFSWPVLLTVVFLGALFSGYTYWAKKIRPFLHLEEAQLCIGNMQLYAPEGGRIVGRVWEEGEFFQRGQTLFSLDHEKSRSMQKEFDVRMGLSTENWEKEKENLEAVMQKYLHLQMEKAPQEFIDRILVDVQEAQQKIMQIEEETSLLEAEKIALESVRNQQSVLAPFDGMILRNFKQVGEMALSGEPILLILNSQSLWVETEIEEEKLSAVKVGLPATVEFKSFRSKKWAAHVSWISPIVEKGKIKVRLAGDNFPVNPGLSAQVSIKIAP